MVDTYPPDWPAVAYMLHTPSQNDYQIHVQPLVHAILRKQLLFLLLLLLLLINLHQLIVAAWRMGSPRNESLG
jgi:hypothetical protein